MAELVDAQDLKSWGRNACTGSIPVPGTMSQLCSTTMDYFDTFF